MARKFQDWVGMQSPAWTDERKVNCLKYCLEGLARDQFDELPTADQEDYRRAIAKLKEFFESPKMRIVARQNLLSARQKTRETVAEFANTVKRFSKGRNDGSARRRAKR